MTMTMTTQQALAEQNARAEHYNALKESRPNGGTNTPAVVTGADGGVLAVRANANAIVNAYLDTVAPAGLYGREINFKEGKYLTRDDGKEIGEDRTFIALIEQIAVGLIKFNGKGNPPDTHMALPYEGQVPPDRASLGDADESQWEAGLSGKKEDPWCPQNYLPLQDAESGEAFTFVTRTVTGIRAVGVLMRHYERLRRTHPDTYPLIRLKKGGFNHRDERIGWVETPALAVVGRHPKDDASKPDTSTEAALEDSIPF